MKKIKLFVYAAASLCGVFGIIDASFAQGTAFTYQGQILSGGTPLNGSIYLNFALYAAATGGSPVSGGGPIAPAGGALVTAGNGLFTVTLDFGSSPNPLTGQALWLELEQSPSGLPGTYSALNGRVQLTATPYAIYSENSATAATASGVAAGSITGAGIASGQVVKSLNGLQDAVSLSAGANVTITPSGNTLTIAASGGGTGTPANIPNTLVERDSTGSFAAGSITLADNLTLPTTSSSSIGVLNLGGVPFLHGYGNQNTFAGPSAGNFTMSGVDNTAIGYDALASDTSGNDNTAVGVLALLLNTTGANNTAEGYEALAFNTSGANNTANGFQALKANSTGFGNTANGYQALQANTQGYYNTAYGAGALYDNTSGVGNTAIGLNALGANTNGIYNTAIGYKALLSNTSGSWNTANGDSALYYNQTGIENTADGDNALNSNTSGYYNTADGYEALYGNMTGYANTANGVDALYDNVSGAYNIALGFEAGDLITGSYNIDIGNQGVAGESGIIRIGVPGTQTATYLAGTVYANGVALTSDRNAKENFATVDPREVLAKVAALPVTEWNYKTDSKDVQHIGPMAQDFHAAFGLNHTDDTHISVLDEGGVALAAIQGLNQKLEATVKQKDAKIEELEKRLERLEELARSGNGGAK